MLIIIILGVVWIATIVGAYMVGLQDGIDEVIEDLDEQDHINWGWTYGEDDEDLFDNDVTIFITDEKVINSLDSAKEEKPVKGVTKKKVKKVTKKTVAKKGK